MSEVPEFKSAEEVDVYFAALLKELEAKRSCKAFKVVLWFGEKMQQWAIERSDALMALRHDTSTYDVVFEDDAWTFKEKVEDVL